MAKVDKYVVQGHDHKEAHGAQMLLEEPKSGPVSKHCILSSAKCWQMDKYSLGDDLGINSHYGALDADETEEEHDLKLDVLDYLLDEVDDVDDIHAASDLSAACADFFPDIEFVDKVSKYSYGPRDCSRFLNPHPENHSPGFSGSSNGANGVSDSSTTTILESECKINKLDNDDNCKVNEMLSHVNEKDSGIVKRVDELIRQKRLRTPIRRYMDEFSGRKACNISTATEKVKLPKAKFCEESLVLDQEEDSSSETSTETLNEYQPCKGHQKEFTPVLTLDSEDDFTDSEDEHVSVGKHSKPVFDRRKHQRMWTLSEVTKLVDGISEYGVGRWTDVKRCHFASSFHRTSVDLRDKWRNLLKASYAEKEKNSKREIVKKRKHDLPKSVLSRICELDTIHPYPTGRNTKLSHDVDVSQPLASSTQVDFASHGGRSIRRKKCS